MADFRCYCLHDDGRIALGEHIEADDLSAAIRNAYEYLPFTSNARLPLRGGLARGGETIF